VGWLGLGVAVGSTFTNLGSEHALKPSISTIAIKISFLFILPPGFDKRCRFLILSCGKILFQK
jgi:hypothetical protein